VRVSMGSFQQISESYRKIGNTIRFLLANTTDFDPETDRVSYQDLESIDQYMQVKINQFTKDVLDDYATYKFMNIYKRLINFLTIDLSAFYLDVAKDIVYIEAANSHKRRSMQTVLYDVAVRLTKLLTPIIPHTTEEIWKYLKEPEEFAQLADMPTVDHHDGEAKLVENWDKFMQIRSHVFKTLEEARDQKLIGKSFEAHVDLYVTDSVHQLLDDLNTNVRQALIVSGLDIKDFDDAPETADKFDNVAVQVTHAAGEVCPRCRMVKNDVGQDEHFPELCQSCAAIVSENFPEAVQDGLEK